VQCRFRGPRAGEFLEYLTPTSLRSLAPFSSTLSVLLLPSGGIIDDTVITKHADDTYYVVTNAGRRDEDLAWFTEQLADGRWKGGVEWEVMENWGLLALQGMLRSSHLVTMI
jgi:aminomethyltransferase